MASRTEGLVLLFIDAMDYGIPVIAGNVDGSADALLHGELGQLVNPESVEEIAAAIANILQHKASFAPNRELLMRNFSYEAYKQNLAYAIN